MTFAATPALKYCCRTEWLPRITATEYDGRNRPADQKSGCTVGMAMTEAGGSTYVPIQRVLFNRLMEAMHS